MSANSVSPPTAGHLDGAQHRAPRRLLPPGDVAVPGVLVAAPVLVGDQHHHLGIPRLGRHERMHLELAELAAERDVLLGGDVLVAEEQHLVVEPRLVQRREGGRIAGLAQVDAADLGADRRRDGYDRAAWASGAGEGLALSGMGERRCVVPDGMPAGCAQRRGAIRGRGLAAPGHVAVGADEHGAGTTDAIQGAPVGAVEREVASDGVCGERQCRTHRGGGAQPVVAGGPGEEHEAGVVEIQQRARHAAVGDPGMRRETARAAPSARRSRPSCARRRRPSRRERSTADS